MPLTSTNGPPALPPDIMTAEDVARYLRVSTKTIRAAVRTGRLPPPTIRLGERCCRWTKAAIDAALTSNGAK